MASFTTTAYSTESSTYYYKYDDYTRIISSETHEGRDGAFNIPLPNLTGAIIRSISVTAPIQETYSEGAYGNFTLKLGGTTLGTWQESQVNTWAASGLAIAGGTGQTITVDLKHSEVVRWHETSSGWTGKAGRLLGRATATISYTADLSASNVEPLSGSSIPRSLPTTFSWTRTSFASITQQILYWKKSTDSTYTAVNLSTGATSYTFPAGTFENGSINWRIYVKDSGNNTAYSPVETVNVGVTPTVDISYPLGVNIKSSNIQIFTWAMHEEVATGQASYEIQYKKNEAAEWTTVTGTSSNQYHTFPANTFTAGDYQWKLKVTNNDELSTDYVNGSFTAIGATEAPVITDVTNSSIPTITWTVTSQDTFEMEIYVGPERIYTSGIQVGHDIRSFTPNIMLEDGNYIIKMRAMNEYGYFTPWLDYAFVLNPEKPDAIVCYAFANASHGITIARSLELDAVVPSAPVEEGNIPSAYYVIRRNAGDTEWTILGKLDILDESVTFDDNTVLPGVAYEYALRNYASEEGYTDSNVVTITVDYPGFIVSRGSECVQLYQSESAEFDITHASNKEQSFSFMIGRKYPVKESSEWVSHSNTMTCFVEFDQYEKLLSFYEGNDDLWFRGRKFSYQCSIDSISIAETLLGKGYELSIEISRTDEGELRLF